MSIEFNQPDWKESYQPVETPENETASEARLGVSNLIDLGVVKTKNDTFEFDDLSPGSVILSEYVDDISREEIKASIGETIYDLVLGDTLYLEDVLNKMSVIDKSLIPDLGGIAVVLFSDPNIDVSKKITIFNLLNKASKGAMNVRPEVIDVLFQSGPLKSLIDNKSITKKMEKLLDEISYQELFEFISYKFPSEDSDKKDRSFSDFSVISDVIKYKNKIDFYKDKKYTVESDEKKWPITSKEAGVDSKELRDFMINDVWGYWKEKRKLPYDHTLELNEKGKVMEFMLTEIFDTHRALDSKNIFPTAKVDDDRVDGAHCDLVVQLDDVSFGVDVFYTLDKDSINKKFRNFIDYNPRAIISWPFEDNKVSQVKESRQEKEERISKKKVIVLPIAVNENIILKIFADYYSSYKKHEKIGISFEQFRDSQNPNSFPGFRKEVGDLIDEFSNYIIMFESKNASKKEVSEKLQELSGRFRGHEVGNSIAKKGSSKTSFKYIDSWYEKYNKKV